MVPWLSCRFLTSVRLSTAEEYYRHDYPDEDEGDDDSDFDRFLGREKRTGSEDDYGDNSDEDEEDW
jgi:hypothetical protein